MSNPVIKWTHELMLEIHQQMWDSYVPKLLKSKLSIKEKNRRLDAMYEWMNLIHDLCINEQLTIKK